MTIMRQPTNQTNPAPERPAARRRTRVPMPSDNPLPKKRPYRKSAKFPGKGWKMGWEENFLAGLVETGIPEQAARRAGIDDDMAYRRHDYIASFRVAWKAARELHALREHAKRYAARSRSPWRGDPLPWPNAWATTFLDALRRSGSTEQAADAAGIDPQTVLTTRAGCPPFNRAYHAALAAYYVARLLRDAEITMANEGADA